MKKAMFVLAVLLALAGLTLTSCSGGGCSTCGSSDGTYR